MTTAEQALLNNAPLPNAELGSLPQHYSRTLVAHEIRVARDRGGSRFLEVGVGSGDTLEQIIAQLRKGDFVLAVDSDRNQVVTVRRRFPQVPVAEMNVAQRAFLGKPFDAVICHGVLTHIHPDSLYEFAVNLASAVNPSGGTLVAAYSHHEYLSYLLQYDRGPRDAIQDPGEIEWAYGEEMIPDALLAAGLKLVGAFDIAGRFEPAAQGWIRAIRYLTLTKG